MLLHVPASGHALRVSSLGGGPGSACRAIAALLSMGISIERIMPVVRCKPAGSKEEKGPLRERGGPKWGWKEKESG